MKNGWMQALAWERTQCEVIEPYTGPCTVDVLDKAISVSRSQMPGRIVLLCEREWTRAIVGVGALGDIGDGQSTPMRDENVREWLSRIVGVR